MNENPTVHPRSRHLLRPMIAAAVLLIVVLIGIANYLEDWLWMRQLDYIGIFWTLLSVQWIMFCSTFVFAFLYLWINLRQAAENSGVVRQDNKPWGPAFSSGANADAQRSIELSPRVIESGRRSDQRRRRFVLCGSVSTPNGILISVFVTADLLVFPIRFSRSMSGFISFICPSMFMLQSSLTLLTIS